MSDSLFLKSILRIHGREKDIDVNFWKRAQVALVLHSTAQTSFRVFLENLAKEHLGFDGPAAKGIFTAELVTSSGVFNIPNDTWDKQAFDIVNGFGAKQINVNIKIPQELDGAEDATPEAPSASSSNSLSLMQNVYVLVMLHALEDANLRKVMAG